MKSMAFEPKRYSVIYADPPWQLKAGATIGGYEMVNGVQAWKNKCSKSRELEYSTMTVEEIADLPVRQLAADDAHLYLWVTNKHLPFAFDVIKSWGFKYSTTIVWAKNMMGGGLGGSFRINTEYLLFATKGKLKSLKSVAGTWHNVKRDYENGYPKHSKKPEYFRGIIEQVSPGNKIELFARKESPGWDVYGNQVNNSISL